jgi:hypothetical protein
MTTFITCPANSQLTEDDLTTLSLVFPRLLRLQLIELRRVLSNRNASFRTYGSGVVTFDMDAMLHEVALKCSSKIAERVSELVAQGLCLQAISGTPLSIPLTGTERISLRT